jgi:hypothetical protein
MVLLVVSRNVTNSSAQKYSDFVAMSGTDPSGPGLNASGRGSASIHQPPAIHAAVNCNTPVHNFYSLLVNHKHYTMPLINSSRGGRARRSAIGHPFFLYLRHKRGNNGIGAAAGQKPAWTWYAHALSSDKNSELMAGKADALYL